MSNDSFFDYKVLADRRNKLVLTDSGAQIVECKVNPHIWDTLCQRENGRTLYSRVRGGVISFTLNKEKDGGLINGLPLEFAGPIARQFMEGQWPLNFGTKEAGNTWEALCPSRTGKEMSISFDVSGKNRKFVNTYNRSMELDCLWFAGGGRQVQVTVRGCKIPCVSPELAGVFFERFWLME